jgi:TetR/AcrR family transcriptional repressor of nem operon
VNPSTNNSPAHQPQSPTPSKTRLLDAALHVIRAKGYAATTVDDICHQAGVTKGSFFHHFKTKDDLALAAIAHWRAMTEAFFAAAPYHQPQDPLDRLLGYLDLRAAILSGELPHYTCLLGTLVQETYDTHPHLRAACHQALASHIAALTSDVEAAKALHAPNAPWSSQSVGSFIQAVLQGSFIFAKAQQSPAILLENIDHLRRYLRSLLSPSPPPQSIQSVHGQAAEEDSEPDNTQSHYTD